MPKKKNQKNKKIDRYPLLVIPAILLVLLFFATLLNSYLNVELQINKIYNVNFISHTSDYPLLSKSNYPQLSANGAVIIDANTKKIIFGKNENVRFSPASTTKVATALTALGHYSLDKSLTVDQNTNIDSVLGLNRGDAFKFEDLLFAMMLPSDNRAADTIAKNFPGGQAAFIAEMRKNIKDWHLFNTDFSDPVGLMDDSDYTTPLDLAVLGSIAMQNDEIRKVVSTKEITIMDIDGRNTYDARNINLLLDYDGVIGLKTGHTDQAGDVLVTAKKDRGHLLIMVVMNSQDRFSDMLKLLEYIRGDINYLSIHP